MTEFADASGVERRLPLDAPVLFLIFNRPDLTARVFERIRDAKPKLLFVAADGPRADREGDAELCASTRAVVDHGVDWDCEVKRLYREANLGCKIAVSSAIDWFFANVEEGIILEDDTLPDPSFFRYCAELLVRYRNEAGVAMISGDNFQGRGFRCEASYYFSSIPHIWGWASWRRAWLSYDLEIRTWWRPRGVSILRRALGCRLAANYFADIFDGVKRGRIDTWDYQWHWAIWRQHARCILPALNLVTNIGFDARATHAQSSLSVPTERLDFPLRHPAQIVVNRSADEFTFRNIYGVARGGTMRELVRKWCRRLKHSLVA